MTLRLRLTLYWAAVLTFLMLLAGVAVFLLFAREQWVQLDSALLEEADTAASAIERGNTGAAAATVQYLSQERDIGPSRRVRLLLSGSVVADYGDPRADLPLTIPLPPSGKVVEGGRRIYRFALMPLRLNGQAGYLADGVDASAVRLSIYRLEKALLVLIPLILVVSISGGYWLAGRAIDPIIALTADLAEIGPRDLARRLTFHPIDDEIARLAQEINGLLERVEHAALAERRFAADAAHELRTPLTILRAGLEVTLARERTNAEYAAALSSALHDTLALCRMTDQLLTLSRLDHDATIVRAPLDLRALVTEVIEDVEPLAESKQIEIHPHLDGGVIVNGSREYLRRMMLNLLHNALKFAPSDGRVAIALEHENGSALIRITDNGPGIEAADLPQIFDRFFRGRSSDESGGGLGLSLCREIARVHDGAITAGNRPGGGAEFVVKIPVVSA